MTITDVPLHSLLAATDVQVLPPESTVADRGDHVVVRTPTNPSFYWGNFILVRDAAQFADVERWERAFADAHPQAQHVAVAIDEPLPVTESFAQPLAAWRARGYDEDLAVALVATPDSLTLHPRSSSEVTIERVELGDVAQRDDVVSIRVDNANPAYPPDTQRSYIVAHLADLARLSQQPGAHVAWFLARDSDGVACASCGVVVVAGRARFQNVDTRESHRGRGVASRLVHDVAQHAVAAGATRLVIGADVHYHAAAMYESLGFLPSERGAAALKHPPR